MLQAMQIDSTYMGDPERHRTLADLEDAFRSLRAAPTDGGRLALIVRKAEGGVRETPDRVTLEPESGVPGDAWGRNPQRKPDAQITVMQRDVAELVTNGQPLSLPGDNLLVDLDISAANLPPGSRVRIGKAILEVTPLAHNGCKKFRARFGDDALRFTATPKLRPRNLRGIHVRVVEGGEVSVGDRIEVISRALVQQTIREVEFGSPEHAATIELRTKVLRAPLGLEFPPGELEGEKHYHHLACYRGSKLAGCLVLQPLVDGDIQMKQVAVAPDLQRQGIGRAMVEFSEKLAGKLGYRRMTMHARETAVEFYEKYGYAKVGKRFVEVTVPHWVMVKSLNGIK
jgi:MOSC domain-containing protein YiiM/predicted GNAT family N-acyltransferase